MGILVLYWYGSDILEILVLNSYVSIMTWYWWIDRSLLLCPELIAKDNEYDVEFMYFILRWISNWKGLFRF